MKSWHLVPMVVILGCDPATNGNEQPGRDDHVPGGGGGTTDGSSTDGSTSDGSTTDGSQTDGTTTDTDHAHVETAVSDSSGPPPLPTVTPRYPTGALFVVDAVGDVIFEGNAFQYLDPQGFFWYAKSYGHEAGVDYQGLFAFYSGHNCTGTAFVAASYLPRSPVRLLGHVYVMKDNATLYAVTGSETYSSYANRDTCTDITNAGPLGATWVGYTLAAFDLRDDILVPTVAFVPPLHVERR